MTIFRNRAAVCIAATQIFIGTGAACADPQSTDVQVDRFGQIISARFPDKMTSEDELKGDVAAEKAYYTGLTPPARDRFGGLPDSGKTYGLKTTGFFHVEKHSNKWYLVDPAGNMFYTMGLCGLGAGDDFTEVAGREKIYEWLPPASGEFKTAYLSGRGSDDFSFFVANTIRKYGKPFDDNEFTARMIDRVQKWGFNSGGPFSSYNQAYKNANFTYTRILPLGEYDGIPPLPGIGGTFDPFDEQNRKTVEKNLARELPGAVSDPLLIGYFFTNEPLYEDIPRVVPKLGSKYACKKRMVAMLQDKYKSIDSFNTAWGMKAASFEQLRDTPLAPSTPDAIQDVRDFTKLFLDTYFKLVANTARKYDKNHMLIGNRFQSGTINNEDLCRIAAKYLDIMSFNYYTYGPDKDFLNRIYKWTGRPMILSEYFYDSPAESGLSGGILDMKTQADRGKAYRNYVEQTAATGYVVGAQWFSLVDQAATGRWFQHYDGERANAGLIAVTDRPWKDAVAQVMQTNYGIYDVIQGKRPPYLLDDPRFTQQTGASKTLGISRASGPVAMDGTAAGFPGVPAEQITGKNLIMGPDAGGVEASFKMCWDDSNLYLLADISDPTPMKNAYTGDGIWNGDGIELFVGPADLDRDGALLPSDRQLLLSGALKDGAAHSHIMQTGSDDAVKMVVVPNTNGKGYTLEAAIPFTALGFTPQPNQQIRFDIGLDDGADDARRIRQFLWNGNARDSSDRTTWGRAKFIK